MDDGRVERHAPAQFDDAVAGGAQLALRLLQVGLGLGRVAVRWQIVLRMGWLLRALVTFHSMNVGE